MNDLIYVLDEPLNKIMKSEQFKAHVVFVNEYIDMICFTTEEEMIAGSFLLPEMVERVASMLNYFLARLVKMLQMQKPKYEFQPEELLVKIVKIYVNLAIRDRDDVFATTIIKDGRSYYVQLFGDAARELKKNGEDGKMINDILKLGRRVKIAAIREIPEEFMDPITSTMMNPVIIPITNVRIDLPVILRHLLCQNTDPFSRRPLTADMLIPDTEIKAKIDSFLQRRDLCHHVP